MISLEQVRLLETKVKQAVEKIQALNVENDDLRSQLAGYEERITELESLVTEFKASQDEIEEGLLKAISQLDEVEQTGAEVSEAESNPEVQEETESEPSEEAEESMEAAPEANEVEEESFEETSEEEENFQESAGEETAEETMQEELTEETHQNEANEEDQNYHHGEPQNLEIF